MESELRHVLERLSGQFDTLSRELADASTAVAGLAASAPAAEPAAPAAAVAVQLPAVSEAPVVAELPPAMRCRRCGNHLQPETRYCTRCGTALAAATAAQPVPDAEPVPMATAAAPPAGPRWTLSETFALRALGWLAGAVTLLGIVFLYALAEQRGWVGPGARVGFGVAVSAALLCAAFLLHARYGDELEALAAAGTAVAGLYVSLFAAVEIYHLVPRAAGLPIALAIAGLAVAIAWWWASEPLAVLGLAGAMVAPPVSEHAVTPFAMCLVVVLAVAAAALLGQARLAVAHRHRHGHLARRGGRHGRRGRRPARAVHDAVGRGRGCGRLLGRLPGGDHPPAPVARQPAVDGVAVAVSVGGAAFAYGTAAALFRGDDRGLAFLALAAAYLVLTAVVWRAGIGVRDLLSAFWAAGLTAGAIGALVLLDGEALVVVLALNGALQVVLARRLGEPRLQLSAAAHIIVATGAAVVVAPPANLLDFPATGLTRNGQVSGDLVLAADLSAIAVAAAFAVFWLRHLPSYIWSASGVRRATFWVAVVGVLYAVSTTIVNGFLWYGYSERSFQNGHTLVSAAWAGIALLLVWFGFRRGASDASHRRHRAPRGDARQALPVRSGTARGDGAGGLVHRRRRDLTDRCRDLPADGRAGRRRGRPSGRPRRSVDRQRGIERVAPRLPGRERPTVAAHELRERLEVLGAHVGEVAAEPARRKPGEHAVDLVARQASRQVGHPALAVEGLIEAVRELGRSGRGAAAGPRAGRRRLRLHRARVHRRTARGVGMPRDGRLRASGRRELRVDGIDLHRILLRDAAGRMRTHAPR